MKYQDLIIINWIERRKEVPFNTIKRQEILTGQQCHTIKYQDLIIIFLSQFQFPIWSNIIYTLIQQHVCSIRSPCWQVSKHNPRKCILEFNKETWGTLGILTAREEPWLSTKKPGSIRSTHNKIHTHMHSYVKPHCRHTMLADGVFAQRV